MSKFEKMGGAADRRTLRLVEKTQEAPAQERAEEHPPFVFPTIALPPSRARTTPVPQSFERFRRAKPVQQEPEAQAKLPALPAPYRAPEQEHACLFCHGLGFLPYGHPEFGRSMPCQCTVRQRVSRTGLAQIPEEFQGRSFASYLEQRLDPEQELVAMQVMKWTMERLDGTYAGSKRGLYLCGSLGIGKTGLAVAALQEAILAGKSGLYLSTSLLLDNVSSV
jgi:DNA replication protein DnaC